MNAHQILYVGNVPIQRPPLIRLERLGCPAELIAQRDADPLGAIIQGENTASHEFTAGVHVRPDQRPFRALNPIETDLCRRPEPSRGAHLLYRPLRLPYL